MRRVLQAARSEALRLGHREIDAPHLLLALFDADDHVRQLLREARVDEAVVRSRLFAVLPPAALPGGTTADLPYSTHAREILTLARKTAERFKHARVEPGHLLLAILDLETSSASRVLAATGFKVESAVRAIQKRA